MRRTAMQESLENDRLHRLWEHGLHEDTIFFQMLSFFLVFESVLLGVVGLLYSKTASTGSILKIIIILGCCVTIVWGYAQVKQRRYIKALSAQAQSLDSNYKLMVQSREKGIWSLSVTGLLAYVIPTLIVLVWITLLFSL